ncbi:uncharacterized protein PHACADRAFT_213221 [Phanerochaete carnosa HHB-10118-sp]|uniref:GmrSD restriction endonucleases N-terminal domain-containing protein n=1 Tax=Phanerochaete carnosa (strain HHB-10118-sp) TaxID=650164 RepID=K5UNR4_PHACS|nr:uncharacterized protein PHACADRAFT_213221 [Phanerochaete carnosa HHB-10118-sp]EKM51386.1 hypothetical protein PHACADRAFT_213221 [Phanerochaete carnosa HHB-10118-sp]
MEDEYLSDLTDVEEEEVQDTLSSSKKARGKAVKGDTSTYRIQGALNAPRATTYNAQHIFDQLEAGDIDLEAEYQRDVVWPIAKQIGLIDSVFRNFYIPPVIFAVTYHSDGSEKRVCIDGKQRLTSIQKFMKGIIPHKDVFTGDKFFYKENPSRTERGKLLPTQYKKVFANKQIVCIEYTHLDEGSEREIFQRVQLGMALTPAEKLQAVSSPSSQFVRTLLALYVHNQLGRKSHKNKNQILQWDTSRGTDFRCVASAVYCTTKASNAEPAMSSLTKWLQQPEELDEHFCKSLHDTFKIFVSLTKHRKWRSCFDIYDKNKLLKVSPAEFITITVLIHRQKGKFTMSQLSEAIEQMRLDIRQVEADVRMNSRCFKHMFGFINKLKASQFHADPENDVAAVAIRSLYAEDEPHDANSEDGSEDEDEGVDQLDATPAPTKAKSKAKAMLSKRKRAKASSDDEDNAEYHPNKRPLTKQSSSTKKSSAHAAKRESSSEIAPPPSSAPPPYSTQPQTDRLEAIRHAKAFQQQPGAPQPPPHQQQQQQALPPGWPNISAALGTGYSSSELSRALLERLGITQGPQPYAPPQPPQPPPSMPYPPEPYGQQQQQRNPPPPIPRMPSGSHYPAGDSGYQHRGGGAPPY